MQAHAKYAAFAKKATDENYPNIAYLFSSLSYSELVHARNFKNILSELKAEILDIEAIEIKCLGTKDNLRDAVKVELLEIDASYPNAIEKIAPEGYSRATQSLTYAWESEKQHRELLQKVSSNIRMFFGAIAKRIEQNPVTYYVCNICGSTVTEIPKYSCFICRSAFTEYKKLEK